MDHQRSKDTSTSQKTEGAWPNKHILFLPAIRFNCSSQDSHRSISRAQDGTSTTSAIKLTGLLAANEMMQHCNECTTPAHPGTDKSFRRKLRKQETKALFMKWHTKAPPNLRATSPSNQITPQRLSPPPPLCPSQYNSRTQDIDFKAKLQTHRLLDRMLETEELSPKKKTASWHMEFTKGRINLTPSCVLHSAASVWQSDSLCWIGKGSLALQ